MKPESIVEPSARVAELCCWSGEVEPRPLSGGITNTNFVVEDGGEKYVVRVGDDLPLHGILRTHELAACRAAHAAGLAPEIVHHETGILVMRFVEGATLTADDLANEAALDRVAALLRECHTGVKDHLYGSTPMFWVFHVCQGYLDAARRGESRWVKLLDRLSALNGELEEAVGAIAPVFCHNDLLPSNFIDDGSRLWLLDWEYAGWNAALFDLANLASNCALPPELEDYLLNAYFGLSPEPQTIRRYHAFKCASLMRETLWSVVQEIHSHLDFDYAAYTEENLSRFETAYDEYARLR